MWSVREALVLMVFCVGCRASFDFNDTTLASLPPLNRVDEWAQCQREDDVYCIVDAALTSDKPSQLLDMLQEFSKQTLKHFNRTLVHRGVCVSRCGPRQDGEQPWHSAAATCLNREMANYGLQAEVLAVKWCASRQAPEPSASARAFIIFVVIMLSFVVLATAVHGLGERFGIVEGNKYLLAFSLKRNWAILMYDRRKPRTDLRMKDLACMEGLRVFFIVNVISAHVGVIAFSSLSVNPEYYEKVFDKLVGQMVLNGPLWLQGFFCMSAFITTYSVLITMDRSPITLLKCFLSFINRYIRLTPALGVTLWFVMTWYTRLGSGPQWAVWAEREKEDCHDIWWYLLVHAQNTLPGGKMCLPQSWYLAADMQLHVIGVLTLYVLHKCRRAVVPVLAAMWIGSALAAGQLAYYNDIPPIITGQNPENLRTFFLNTSTAIKLYVPSYMNLVGYAAGMACAYIYHYTQVVGVKLNQKKWFNIVYHLSLPLGTAVVAAGVVFLQDAAPEHWVATLYSVLDRSLVAVCFAVFLLGCVAKCKSALREFLEWRGFQFLGRISYSVFLLHFIVIVVLNCTDTQLVHLSFRLILTRLISASVISVIVAIPFSLVFELPPLQLFKALTEGDRSRPQEATPPPTEPVKPLDLVANIRRQEV